MTDLKAALERSIPLAHRKAAVREALYFLETAITHVETLYPKTDEPLPAHRIGLRNLKLWCAPGSELEREIMDAITKEIA